MEFDSNFKDDLPLLSSFFSDKTDSKLKLDIDVDSGGGDDGGEFLGMELPSSSSSKGLFHSLQVHHYDHHHQNHQYLHHFPINGSDSINPQHHNFSIDGSLQSLISGMNMPASSQSCNFDPNFEPNFLGNEFSKDHTFENGAKFMHGLLGSGAVWTNFPGNFLPQISQLPNSNNNNSIIHQAALGSASMFLDHEASCITADSSGFNDQNKKKKRVLQIRKENKPPKKLPNIIKGQWTPQEDRYNYN